MPVEPIVSYDGAFTLSATGPLPSASVSAVTLGNGKIALVPSMTSVDTVAARIGSSATASSPSYAGQSTGLLPLFHFNRVRVILPNATATVTSSPVAVQTLSNASLNMYTGILTLTFALSAGSTALGSLETDIYPVAQLPFCSMQTCRLQLLPAAYDGLTGVGAVGTISHEVYAPSGLLSGGSSSELDTPTFNTTVRFVGPPRQPAALTMLTAEARYDGGRTCTRKVVAMACSYLLDVPSHYAQYGGGVSPQDRMLAYNRIALLSSADGSVPDTYRFSVLTATMSTDDFPNPLDECIRLLVAVVSSSSAITSTRADSAIRSAHVGVWADNWKTRITLTPKTQASPEEVSRLLRVQRAARYAQFQVFASTRPGAAVAMDPSALGLAALTNASLLYSGDTFLLPTLLLLRPAAARTILEFRAATLDAARRLAAGFGLAGVQYPSTNVQADVLGAYRTPFFYATPMVPVALYNSCLIAIGAWNYYRVGHDIDWLVNSGWPILRGVADMLASAAVVTSDGAYHLVGVPGLSGSAGADDDAYTVYLTRLALTFAIQCAFELRREAAQAWFDVRGGLAVSTFSSPTGADAQPSTDIALLNVIMPNSATTRGAAAPAVLDFLLPLLPFYASRPLSGESCSGCLAGNSADVQSRNLTYWSTHQAAGTATLPVNQLLTAGLWINKAQSSTTPRDDADTFATTLDAFLDLNVDRVWGNLLAPDTLTYASDSPPGIPAVTNDLGVAGTLLFILLTCVAGVVVQGTVSSTHAHPEPFRINVSRRSGALPTSWMTMTVTGIGQYANLTSVVTNKLTYTSSLVTRH